MTVYFRLDPNDLKKVYSVYVDLSKDELLHKCIQGLTQNPNESLHSKVWHSLSKTKFFGLNTIKYSVTHTVHCHNFGYESASISEKLGFGSMPVFSAKALRSKDVQRKRSALSPKGSRVKRHRKSRSDPSYEAGGY